MHYCDHPNRLGALIVSRCSNPATVEIPGGPPRCPDHCDYYLARLRHPSTPVGICDECGAEMEGHECA